MGDIPSHVVFVPARPRFGRLRPALGAVLVVALCLTLTGGTAIPAVNSPAFLISGMSEIPAPPRGTSWSSAPITMNGLSVLPGPTGNS